MLRDFRFCPGCGLPISGEAPLSTQIREVRLASEPEPRERGPSLGGFAVRLGALLMLCFMAFVGALLFHPPLLDRLMPARPVDTTPPLTSIRSVIEPEWVLLPPAKFPFGDSGNSHTIDYELRISRYEVTNELWWKFLRSEQDRLRTAGRLSGAYPGRIGGWSPLTLPLQPPPKEILDQPVRYVTALAAEDFCAWLMRQLDQSQWLIRLPTSAEWEYAARGEEDRQWPWGASWTVTVPHSGKRRVRRRGLGLADQEPFPIEMLRDDQTPDGVVGMGTNVSEWAVQERVVGAYHQMLLEREVLESLHGPYARQLSELDRTMIWTMEIRGAAYPHDGDEARQLAQTWSKRPYNEAMRVPSCGVRIVKVRRAAFESPARAGVTASVDEEDDASDE